ncbi:MAG: hypothetical protein ACRD10_10965, partial [Terriglobia bacterium]
MRGISAASWSAPFSAPVGLIEEWHRERVLCSVRSLAALCSLGILYFDRALGGPHAQAAHLLLVFYLVYSVGMLWCVRVYRDCRQSFLLCVQAADILWPVLLSLFTAGPNSPFPVLFGFAVVAAAYRWGLRETLGTALASVLAFLAETVFVTSDWGGQFNLLRGEFHFSTFLLEIIGILLFGILLGHLADAEQKFRGQTLA